jgi:Fe-Mn family superoxide dismutase
MDKRTFLKTSGVLALGTLVGCATSTQLGQSSSTQEFQLQALGYPYSALEPFIDTQTMEIHHSKHHAAYVNNLNNALKTSPLKGKSLLEILQQLDPLEAAIRNNAGGHFNHSLFWNILKPGGTNSPKGALLESINVQFGSYQNFKTAFEDQAKKVFGSGWVWLCSQRGKLSIVSTANQDNPLMAKLVDKVSTPILGIDVWEHAYYLKYQNRRAEYIEAFFKVINWKSVEENFSKA